MNAVAPAVRILAVCTHNRTRSVMMAALLQSMLDERLGAGAVVVESAGVGPPDLPPIPDAVDAMAQRGLDISEHLSRPVTREIVDGADLILTAERDHVVRVATTSPGAFAKTMTLPELIDRASAPEAGGDDFDSWLASITGARTTASYLREVVGEIEDPTGSAPRAFAAAVDRLSEQCSIAADLLAARVPSRAG